MEKQEGIQGLILRGGGDGSVCGTVREIVADLLFSERTWVLRPVILDVADNPTEICLLGPVGVSFSATGRPDAIQK